ncbi:Rhomboid family protein [Pedosphaera parvula Ellin514]|uniref:Rhomboid family protein n=2 Tax=Pedosphaera TaxID=1032526 RepID=B9XF12_PEDPL|nr:Rhomboid family protein [Pedosphaera parvula Ellin514]
MRQRSRWEPQWSVTVVLIILNVVMFVVQNTVGPRDFYDLQYYGVLSLDGLKHGFIWQLLTFQFLHQGFFHILGNMLTLYFFGHAVEEALGKTSFLKLYLLSGVLGGLLQMGGAVVWPSHLDVPIVGASAGVYGLIAAYATLFSDRSINLLFPPIELKVRTLVWIAMGFSIIGIIVPFWKMAHCAHLGGILTGMFYIRWITQVQKPLVVWQPFRPKMRRRELVKVRSDKPKTWIQPKNVEPEELPSAEFISKEVDPILDKISAHGIQSLTERERQILEAARARMAKRK